MGKRDSTMLKVDEFLCSAMNVKTALTDCFKSKELLKRNRMLKLGDGEKDVCFVLGNGPSLKKVDLKSIENYPCFTVNMFYDAGVDFESMYHVCIDPVFGEDPYFDNIMAKFNHKKNMKLILRDTVYKRIVKEEKANDRIFFVRPHFLPCGNRVRYDMTKGMDGSLNVVPVAIECALFMGYKKVYLLGCDFNSYAVAQNQHFYDKEGYVEKAQRTHIIGDLIRGALVQKQHYALDECGRKNGQEIINLTEGSLIDAYKREELADVLKTLEMGR